jgi:hypothetical protein
MSDRIQQRIHQVLDFSFLGDSFAASILLHVIDLFRCLMSIFFMIDFCEQNFSRGQAWWHTPVISVFTLEVKAGIW